MAYETGYCCINLTLGKQGITTGRTMRKATFIEKGLSYASELAYKNSEDLIKILNWNVENNVKVFRIGSNIFPWNSEYELSELPNIKDIEILLSQAGEIVKNNDMRVSFHPDHFVKLASSKPEVVRRSIKDLDHHDEIFQMMNLPTNHYYPLNIHVGMNFSENIVENFIHRFSYLKSTTKNRLVVENDDKANAFSVKQIFNHIFSRIGTPITFDYFHHEFHPDGLTSHEAAHLAASTWGETKPLFHYSESKNLNEDLNGNPRAHSDYAFNNIDDYGLDIDIDLEVKAKELAWFKYKELTL
jgi:UV DNA damage endonuclease